MSAEEILQRELNRATAVTGKSSKRSGIAIMGIGAFLGVAAYVAYRLVKPRPAPTDCKINADCKDPRNPVCNEGQCWPLEPCGPGRQCAAPNVCHNGNCITPAGSLYACGTEGKCIESQFGRFYNKADCENYGCSASDSMPSGYYRISRYSPGKPTLYIKWNCTGFDYSSGTYMVSVAPGLDGTIWFYDKDKNMLAVGDPTSNKAKQALEIRPYFCAEGGRLTLNWVCGCGSEGAACDNNCPTYLPASGENRLRAVFTLQTDGKIALKWRNACPDGPPMFLGFGDDELPDACYTGITCRDGQESEYTKCTVSFVTDKNNLNNIWTFDRVYPQLAGTHIPTSCIPGASGTLCSKPSDCQPSEVCHEGKCIPRFGCTGNGQCASQGPFRECHLTGGDDAVPSGTDVGYCAPPAAELKRRFICTGDRCRPIYTSDETVGYGTLTECESKCFPSSAITLSLRATGQTSYISADGRLLFDALNSVKLQYDPTLQTMRVASDKYAGYYLRPVPQCDGSVRVGTALSNLDMNTRGWTLAPVDGSSDQRLLYRNSLAVGTNADGLPVSPAFMIADYGPTRIYPEYSQFSVQ